MQRSEFRWGPPSGKSYAPLCDVSCKVRGTYSSLLEIRPTRIEAIADCVISGAMSTSLDSGVSYVEGCTKVSLC